jgi:hypothetical protein
VESVNSTGSLPTSRVEAHNIKMHGIVDDWHDGMNSSSLTEAQLACPKRGSTLLEEQRRESIAYFFILV